MKINIGDIVRLNPSISYLVPKFVDNTCVGIVEDLFLKHDRIFCVVHWKHKNFKSTIFMHDLILEKTNKSLLSNSCTQINYTNNPFVNMSNIKQKSKFKSIW